MADTYALATLAAMAERVLQDHVGHQVYRRDPVRGLVDAAGHDSTILRLQQATAGTTRLDPLAAFGPTLAAALQARCTVAGTGKRHAGVGWHAALVLSNLSATKRADSVQ